MIPLQRAMFVIGLCLGLLQTQALGEDCEPKRNCDATRDCTPTRNCDATRDCSLQVDNENCDGIDKFPCELRKAAKNKAYEADKTACEVIKAGEKLDCERIKTQEKADCEAKKVLEKLDCERVKTQMRTACELGLDGPFSCSADEVLAQLRTSRQEALTDFDELAASLTTPIKNAAGQLAWRETACSASGVGTPYRNSQRSSDGFCTVDVELTSFSIEGKENSTPGRYIRLELLPSARGASICAQRTISMNDQVKFGGPVKLDKHFPGRRWLEVHVTDDFQVADSGHVANPQAGASQPPASLTPGESAHGVRSDERTHLVQRGESLSKIAEGIYGRQVWRVLYSANAATIENPDLIYPGQRLTIPEPVVNRR